VQAIGLWTDANATPPWNYRRGGDLVAATAAYDKTGKDASQGSGAGPVKMSKTGICHAPGFHVLRTYASTLPICHP